MEMTIYKNEFFSGSLVFEEKVWLQQLNNT